MKVLSPEPPVWLSAWMTANGVELWGVADVKTFATPLDAAGQGFPWAISLALPVNPQIMAGIQHGPTQAYAAEYDRLNARLNQLSGALALQIKHLGGRAQALAASERTDFVNIKGEFPHKTAATQAGLGWIGRHCQLISRRFGPWIRLGTIFTDMDLPAGPPVGRHFCGTCTRCVAACPAQALTGRAWEPGLPRAGILDAGKCDRWKKANYGAYHQGHVCGICTAVCPFGLKVLSRYQVQHGGQG